MYVQEEPGDNVFDEADSLTKRHWTEVGAIEGPNYLNLSRNHIKALEERNAFKTFVARDNKNQIIGYACYLIQYDFNCVDELVAMLISIYIHPVYRRTLLAGGAKLLTLAENILIDKYEVDILSFIMNLNYDISKFLYKMDYKPSEVKFSKRVSNV